MIFLMSQLGLIGISIIIFLGVILLLVIVLLYAKHKLLPSGEVKLTINEDKEIQVEPGTTLLTVLGDNKIFLPSGCGGGGTCGTCTCQVFSGGGSILATETGFFTRKEQNNQWRLACQVKVKEDINIGIPKEIQLRQHGCGRKHG